MIKGFKNNPLACGLLGFIIGSGGTLGTQALMQVEKKDWAESISHVSTKKTNNFEIVPYSENGDVVITAHGSKYHSENCYTLTRAKRIQRVNSEDAIAAGIEPCSKCQ